MDWYSLLVSAVLGFILGFLAASFASGVRRMLASFVIKRKLIVGSISKSVQVSHDSPESIEHYIIWCIPIHVKAGIWWNLLVSSVEDVTAWVSFIHRKQRDPTVWINPYALDSSSISLRIGTKSEIAVAYLTHRVLKPHCNDSLDDTDALTGDEDILLELKAGDTTLGRWLFNNAIKSGSMQEVSPIKVKCHHINLH